MRRTCFLILALCSICGCTSNGDTHKGHRFLKTLEFNSYNELCSSWNLMDNYYYEEKPIIIDCAFDDIDPSSYKYLIEGIYNENTSNQKNIDVLYGRHITIEFSTEFIVGFDSNNYKISDLSFSWKIVGYRKDGKWIESPDIYNYNFPIQRRYGIDYDYLYTLCNTKYEHVLSVFLTHDRLNTFEEHKDKMVNLVLEKYNA